MADQPIPYPPAKPLERLHVHDGLMMNAERWRLAHHYHRQRQNVHYQALFQPGIVYGLGAKVIQSPQSSVLRYRSADEQQGERRWLEIQAGLAIDREGNPIIVDASTDRTYRIAINPPTTGRRTVYVVVSYVDPDTLDYQPTKLTVPERFRFDQKTSPPTEREIELCRIELEPDGIFLRMPEDIFAPDVNEINLLHRVQAQVRSQTYIQLGVLAPAEADTYENCAYLMRSLSVVYPSFQGSLYPLTPQRSPLLDPTEEAIYTCDLLYADAQALLNLDHPSAIDSLKRYFRTGGMLLIQTPAADPELEQRTYALLPQLLPSEMTEQTEHSNQIPQPWSHLNLSVPLSPEHPLRTQPFVFTRPPILNEQAMQIATDGGVIWVRGDLSRAWGIRGDYSRSDIRTAQEFGINLLYYAWHRRHLMQLMQWSD